MKEKVEIPTRAYTPKMRRLCSSRQMFILIVSGLFITLLTKAFNRSSISADTALPQFSYLLSKGYPLFHHRKSDVTDTFAAYKHRSECPISSLDLHTPFAPLCSTRTSLLEAMSSGGRIGFDAPYIPRGCDMRWYTTEEACEILGRWDKIVVTGDSMMRHLVGALNVIIRKDLGYGAVTDWNFRQDEREQCFCLTQFNVKTCSMQGIFKTADVEKHDPESLACGVGKVDIFIEEMVKYPIPADELKRFNAAISAKGSTKPIAFIFGMGLWNDLRIPEVVKWIDTVDANIKRYKPHLARPGAFYPRLFVTPNAAGKEKLDEYILSQGDKPLQHFEEALYRIGKERGMEVLGTWNATVQMRKWDGVHLDLRGNLLKAMMVLNWLDMLKDDMPE